MPGTYREFVSGTRVVLSDVEVSKARRVQVKPRTLVLRFYFRDVIDTSLEFWWILIYVGLATMRT